jgi:hypothetical protein
MDGAAERMLIRGREPMAPAGLSYRVLKRSRD